MITKKGIQYTCSNHAMNLLITACLLLLTIFVRADGILLQDSIQVLQPTTATIEKLQADDDLNYNVDLDGSTNFISRAWRKFLKWLEDLFSIEEKAKAAGKSVEVFPWKGLGYFFTAIVIIFLLLKLFKLDLSFLLKNVRLKNELEYTAGIENIHELMLDDLYSQSLQQKNYRLATRYRFLNLLKTANDSGFIKWKPDKTNMHYIQEISTDYRKSFASIVRDFEYVWYGDFDLDESTFELIDKRMSKLLKELNTNLITTAN
ncbi:MAG: hypothetical protein IPO27_01520 [Bacteroidetes bacterium]|nr:hypothetical protein [Bacteroidota bacterium]